MAPTHGPRPRITRWGYEDNCLVYISCEGCNETWSWDQGDKRLATFSEWYDLLDEILLNHLVKHPLCWANQTRNRARHGI